MDRIDIFTEVGRIEASKFLVFDSQNHQNLNVVKNTIKDALAAQSDRYDNSGTFNASIPSHQINAKFALSDISKKFLDTAATSLNLSARSYFKVIKVARTIADLDSSLSINPSHLTEALSYRYKSAKNAL